MEKNTHIVLRAKVDSLKNCTLSLAAMSFYRLTVNGKFVAFGPARVAAGYARVDIHLLSSFNRADGKNEIIIEVVGYACRSLSTVYESSFVCAELCCGEEVLLYTGRDFVCYLSAKYLQKVERYSAQRHFGEVCDMCEKDPFCDRYRMETTPCSRKVRFLERVAPMPAYRDISASAAVTVGVFEYDETLPCRNTRSSFPIDARWGRYEEDEIRYKPYRWIQQQKQNPRKSHKKMPFALRANEYAIVDLSRIEAGFLKFSAVVSEESDVVIGFTELCAPDSFAFTNINCQNVLEYILPEGKHELMSFEPYTCRFAIVLVKSGILTLESFGILSYEYDMSKMIPRTIEDAELRSIYEAAVNTFAHNAVDIYMDCPSRERAGWLCDSYFTGIAEYFFSEKATLKRLFLKITASMKIQANCRMVRFRCAILRICKTTINLFRSGICGTFWRFAIFY